MSGSVAFVGVHLAFLWAGKWSATAVDFGGMLGVQRFCTSVTSWIRFRCREKRSQASSGDASQTRDISVDVRQRRPASGEFYLPEALL